MDKNRKQTLRTILTLDDENLEKVSASIMKNLSPDLLPKKYRERNGTNITFGHCHTVAGCLYRIFGPKQMKMMRALDNEGIWHWWIEDKNGNIIDLTKDQYYSEGRIPPYENGKKVGMLGFDYKKRVLELYNRVTKELGL